MSKTTFLNLVFVTALCVLFVGCAKKKVVTSIPHTEEKQTTVLTQEDLTKKIDKQKAQQLTNVEVGEYAIETGKEKIEKEEEIEQQKSVTLPPKDEEILTKRIHFAFDSYELSEEAKEILKKKAEILLKYPEIKMVIEGHCDERGTDEYNLALGERRAKAAYDYLILLGVEADRLSIVSYGEEKPLDPRHNEEAWAKNRRDEFKIVK